MYILRQIYLEYPYVIYRYLSLSITYLYTVELLYSDAVFTTHLSDDKHFIMQRTYI